MVEYLCNGSLTSYLPPPDRQFYAVPYILDLQLFDLFIYRSAFFGTNFPKIIELQVFVYKPAPNQEFV